MNITKAIFVYFLIVTSQAFCTLKPDLDTLKPPVVAAKKLVDVQAAVVAGHDINAVDYCQETRLFKVTGHNTISEEMEVIRYLLSQGADITVKNMLGQTAQQAWHARGLPQVAALFNVSQVVLQLNEQLMLDGE